MFGLDLIDHVETFLEFLSFMQEAAKLLYRVNQCEVDRIHSALIPVMRALIKKELLDHTDPGVKLAVVSCLTTLIKIRAPDPPYDDDVMKVTFSSSCSSGDEMVVFECITDLYLLPCFRMFSSLLLGSSVNWMMWTAPPMEQGFQCLELLQGYGVVPCC